MVSAVVIDLPGRKTFDGLLRHLAGGPCRTLDAEIGVAVGYLQSASLLGPTSTLEWFQAGDRPGFPLRERWRWGDCGSGVAAVDGVPPDTALLDAALTLYCRRPERVPSNPCQARAGALHERLQKSDASAPNP